MQADVYTLELDFADAQRDIRVIASEIRAIEGAVAALRASIAALRAEADLLMLIRDQIAETAGDTSDEAAPE